MREDHMQHQRFEPRREIGQAVDGFLDHGGADLDVAEELAFERVFEAGLPSQFADLADIVKYDAGYNQVAHQHGVVRNDAVGQADETDDVLQQAAEPGVVQLLGSGGFDEGLAEGGVSQDGSNEALEVGVGKAGNGCFEPAPQLGDIVSGGGQQVGAVEFCVNELAQALDLELQNAFKFRDRSADLDDVAFAEVGGNAAVG